jgi:hypothetical protein
MTVHVRKILNPSSAAASLLYQQSSKVLPMIWRVPRTYAPVADDYVMPWPSSVAPKQLRPPAVRADFELGAQPSSSPVRQRGVVAADYELPVHLISSMPLANLRRRLAPSALARGASIESHGAWPTSPATGEPAVDDSFVYDWPSSLAMRAVRSRITDPSYTYELPSSAWH